MALAERIGWPLLVKAVGGGGGRGLKLVSEPSRLDATVELAKAEAGAAFADSRVYLERFVASGRHVEVQIVGDGESVIHLGDRDCSVQRRYQKLVEEAPAPCLPERAREGMRRAAVAFGRHLKYLGLGTVEFLYDRNREEFYFLEMNARIQVEHPVTEAITGLDLVAEQIAIAEGRKLRLAPRGHPLRGPRHRMPAQRRGLDARLPADAGNGSRPPFFRRGRTFASTRISKRDRAFPPSTIRCSPRSSSAPRSGATPSTA